MACARQISLFQCTCMLCLHNDRRKYLRKYCGKFGEVQTPWSVYCGSEMTRTETPIVCIFSLSLFPNKNMCSNPYPVYSVRAYRVMCDSMGVIMMSNGNANSKNKLSYNPNNVRNLVSADFQQVADPLSALQSLRRLDRIERKLLYIMSIHVESFGGVRF